MTYIHKKRVLYFTGHYTESGSHISPRKIWFDEPRYIKTFNPDLAPNSGMDPYTEISDTSLLLAEMELASNNFKTSLTLQIISIYFVIIPVVTTKLILQHSL